MNYLDRALYYTDRPAKAFKNGDALRKLIYASLVDLSCTNEQYFDVKGLMEQAMLETF